MSNEQLIPVLEPDFDKQELDFWVNDMREYYNIDQDIRADDLIECLIFKLRLAPTPPNFLLAFGATTRKI